MKKIPSEVREYLAMIGAKGGSSKSKKKKKQSKKCIDSCSTE